ncbi:MAG TPA: FkbM family methyltransferase [Halomicronema sp.]|jgi:FkbM family methyltransferase
MSWQDEVRVTQEIIEWFAKDKKDVYFIQIGCCDGVVGDCLHDLIIRYQWRGILIEPVKYLFEKLRANYEGCDQLIFCNVAISSEDGSKDFWYLRKNDDGLPVWYDQLGSFFPDVVLKHEKEIPNIRDYLVSEKIACVSFNSLVEKYNIKQVDIVQIDTEGYDFEILKQVDFEKFRPSIVIYEHKHLSQEDKEASQEFLRGFGYKVIYDSTDSIGLMGDFVDGSLMEHIKNSHLFVV